MGFATGDPSHTTASAGIHAYPDPPDVHEQQAHEQAHEQEREQKQGHDHLDGHGHPSSDRPGLERWARLRFPGLGEGARGLDVRATVVMLSASLLLVVFRKFGGSSYFEQNLAWPTLRGESGRLSLWGDGYWFLACFVLLGVLPFSLNRIPALRPPTMGVGLGDWRFGIKWTVGLFLPMFVIVMAASRFDTFAHYYPLNQALGREAVDYFAGRGTPSETFLLRFVAYEVLYAIYFIGWEYFFRGHLTFGLFERLGANGVLVGTIPFALMHVGKPFPEALGSIIAGVALGLFALRARSFWYGFVLHAAIAWSMDFWALQSKVAALAAVAAQAQSQM